MGKMLHIAGVEPAEGGDSARQAELDRGQQACLPSAVWAVYQNGRGIERNTLRASDASEVLDQERSEPQTHGSLSSVALSPPRKGSSTIAKKCWATATAPNRACSMSSLASGSAELRNVSRASIPRGSTGCGRCSGSSTASQLVRLASS